MEMANVTVAVPEELKKKMEHVPDVNWSEVARQAFEETIRRKQMLEASESIDRLRESSKTQTSLRGNNTEKTYARGLRIHRQAARIL